MICESNMTNTVLDIRAHYALALVSHTIHDPDVGEEREADVYFGVLEMGKKVLSKVRCTRAC